MQGIHGFNGGLFEKEFPSKILFSDFKDSKFFKEQLQNSKLSLKSTSVDVLISLSGLFTHEINPIIKNLLILDSYDFTSDLNVNILGHIFEQSISDIEALHGTELSQRKKDGAYYTPDYITDYICKNTIIPYLSKNNSTSVIELVNEYSENLKELESRIIDLKILDPACGSGAFLLKAIDILLEIHREIQHIRESRGQYSISMKGKKHKKISEQFTLTKWNEESEIKKIIENNIFGVDINPESVEITKLSLFLKLAGAKTKLTYLSNNIKVGNSLINDKKVVDDAFSWKNEFSEILDPLIKERGFDIIIGNPPYVRQELVKIYSNYLGGKYSSFSGKADLYVYFFERASHLLKKNGLLGYISSGKFLEAGYGKQLLDHLTSELEFKQIINFGDLEVFEGVTAYPLILIGKKSRNDDYQFFYTEINDLDFTDLNQKLSKQKPSIINVSDFKENDYKFYSKEIIDIINKVTQKSITLKEFCGLPLVGVKTGYNEGYLTDENVSKLVKPYIFGRDIKKYGQIVSNSNIVFPYVHDGKNYNLVELNKSPNIEKMLSSNKNKLEKRAIIKDGIKNGNKTWYEYQQINRNLNFDNEYIVYPNVSLGNNFTISSGNIVDMTGFIIPSNNRYVLAILNSELVEFLMKLWAISRRGGYLEYKVQYLSKIPIKTISEKEQEQFVEKVNTILSLQGDFISKKQKFLNRIYSFFNSKKISRQLDNFYKINFDEFISEVKKIPNTKLSLKDEEEWEEYFEERKQELLALNNKIEKLDDEIDELVYNLYSITNNEKEIIKEVLKH